MAHVNKMYMRHNIFLLHRMSSSLLPCVYRTRSYHDDDEKSTYRAVLPQKLPSNNFVDLFFSIKDDPSTSVYTSVVKM